MKKFSLYLILCLTSLLVCSSLVSINKDKGKERIEFLKKQIQQTEEILNQLNSDQSNFISQIKARQGLINHRNELINNIQTELQTSSIKLQNLESNNKIALEKLEEYKRDYQRIARQKNINRFVYQGFQLLNKVEWTEILKKIVWKEQLDRFRIQRFLLYKKSQDSVITKQSEIKNNIEQQKELLLTQADEKSKLEKDFTNLQDSYKEIQNKQKDFASMIVRFNAEQAQLEGMINSSIKSSTIIPNPHSNHSELNLSFPLKGGTITSRFGNFQDPNNRQITIRNKGIDIRSKESFVTTSSDCEVLQIRQLPNGSFFVLTRYEDLYIVYSNLDKVLVKPSEKLNRGSNLGELKPSSSGAYYELHFEVWQGKTALDPMKYL